MRARQSLLEEYKSMLLLLGTYAGEAANNPSLRNRMDRNIYRYAEDAIRTHADLAEIFCDRAIGNQIVFLSRQLVRLDASNEAVVDLNGYLGILSKLVNLRFFNRANAYANRYANQAIRSIDDLLKVMNILPAVAGARDFFNNQAQRLRDMQAPALTQAPAANRVGLFHNAAAQQRRATEQDLSSGRTPNNSAMDLAPDLVPLQADPRHQPEPEFEFGRRGFGTHFQF